MATYGLGYQQAIDNLAYHIVIYDVEDFNPILEENQFITEESMEEQIKFLDKYMTPEQRLRWDTLDGIIPIIMSTYNVSFEQVMTDTFARMLEYDIESGRFPGVV